jgi:tRNA(Arg) A34 adenosine deaminase TadA
MSQGTHPPQPPEGRLADFWASGVKDLVLLPIPAFSPEVNERQTFYCLLLMALVAHYWNGNKRGREGTYPWREKQKASDGHYLGGDYLGHNIACLAADGQGEVIDFDFNHNDLLNSSVEHAESRLIRRVFSLTQVYDSWFTRGSGDPPKSVSYSTLLSEVTVYTSLESCSQCSGIMALGSVKDVVFLQRDPGQNSIGNILRNLSPVGGRYLSPLPIPGDSLRLDCFRRLSKGYQEFCKGLSEKPFYISPQGVKDDSPSITSYLCTDDALCIFQDGRRQFEGTKEAKFPSYRPKDCHGAEIQEALTNEGVLAHVKRFFTYAVSSGHRGTPHKL